ncbi:hypothetical protein V3G39_18010 (plasmid) [Dermatophilaceae bacterium Sec6.4]
MTQGLFDPSRVPVYPVVRMSLVGDLVTVDDVVVVVPPGVEPRIAGLNVVAARAAARQGAVQAVRAVACDGAGNSWPVVVDGHGKMWPLDTPGATPVTGKRSGSGRTRSRVGVRLAVSGSAVALAVAVMGGVVLLGHSGGAGAAVATVTVTPSATPTELPVTAPVGWSAQASWSSVAVPAPSGASTPAPMVAVSGTTVFTVITRGVGGLSVAALHARTGAVAWARPVTGSQVTAGPVLGAINGAPVVMVATNTAVVAFTPAGVPVGSWTVPVTAAAGSSAVVLTPAGPILPRTQTTVSIVGPDNTLMARALPPGGRAVAVLGGGAVLVTDTTGHAYKVTSPTVAGTPIGLPAPKGYTGGVTVAVTATQLVQSWSPTKATAGGGAPVQVLRASALSTLTPSWTGAQIPATSGATGLMTSPDGRTGVAGARVVNLTTGAVGGLPAGWSPLGVGNGVIWCHNANQQVVAVTASGAVIGGAGTGTDPAPTPGGGTGQPVTPYALVGRSALVLAAADSVPRLYLLPADPGAATSPAPSPTSITPAATTPPVPSSTASTPAKKTPKKPSTKPGKKPSKKPSVTSSKGGRR